MRRTLAYSLSSFIGTAIVFGALIVAFDVGWRVWSTLRPASAWLEVERVYVADASVNSSPIMQVDRTINQSFRGYWIAEVQRKFPSGFATICTAEGKNLYAPGEGLPESLDLDWWTWPQECRPEPGTYRVATNWQIVVDDYPPKQVSYTSNEFEIFE